MYCTILLAMWFAASEDILVDLIPRIEHAVIVGSVEELEQCRGRLRAIADDPAAGKTWPVRYALAYVDWRLFPLLSARRDKRSGAFLQEARNTLTALIKEDPGNAEAHALLSTVYGQEIGSSFWRGITTGPKASSAIKTALRLAGENPRVALQAGVSALMTPGMFGGGLDKAEKELRRAEELFAHQPGDQAWPNWGRLDVLAWMGQVLAKKGDLQGARSYYQRALTLQPDYGWVRDVLLPALEKQEKKQ
jgi:tetratricopeptide (TPR) repeat protein